MTQLVETFYHGVVHFLCKGGGGLGYGESECIIFRIYWISVKGVMLVWQEFAAKPRKIFELIFPTFQKLDLIFFLSESLWFQFFFLGEPPD